MLVDRASAHAIMTAPAPRPNLDVSPGVKLQPFANAKTIADAGCGGLQNNDPGVQTPAIAYTPGVPVQVSWQLTIPHPADVLDTGVRIAIHYSATDSFAQNIVAGGLTGDPPFTPVSAGPAAAVSNSIQTQSITLPPGKTCDYCTLQWVWAAQQDGGSYIGCADISITTNGVLPNFAALPPQTGNVLPGVPGQVAPIQQPPGGGVGGVGGVGVGGSPPPPPFGASGGSGSCGLGGGGGFFLGMIVGLITTPLLIYAYRRKMSQPAPPSGAVQAKNVNVQIEGMSAAPAVPAQQPPPPSTSGLPEGWTEGTDPTSGRMYYYHAPSGQSSWTRPT